MTAEVVHFSDVRRDRHVEDLVKLFGELSIPRPVTVPVETSAELPASFPGHWDRLYRAWLSDDDFLHELPDGPDSGE